MLGVIEVLVRAKILGAVTSEGMDCYALLQAPEHVSAKKIYDLMLTDFDMPVLNGFQLACCIKKEDSGIKVVVMTGTSQPQVAVYMDRPEVDGWLFKPFGLQALSTVMAQVELPNAFQARLSPKRAAAG